MDTANFEFIKNKKGLEALLCGKYRYNLSANNKNGTSRWRCVQRGVCSATITINKEKTCILRTTNHSCASRRIENEELIKLNACKEEVCYNFEPIQKIFEKHFESLKKECSSDEIDYIPTFGSVKDAIYLRRKMILKCDRLNYKSIEEISVPEGLGKRFLVCEDGSSSKIIIFCSIESRRLLKNPMTELCFFGDGTFKCVPQQFYQLYTLHVDLFSNQHTTNILPIIFALLPNKTEATYVRLLILIRSKLGVEIKNFKCDFEIAVINAIKIIYPNCQTTTCFYHFNKNVWKKAKALNVTGNSDGRNLTRMASLLPLLPFNRISNAWISIANSAPLTDEIVQFKKYFEEQWILKLNPKILSCAYERHRTTNPLEGWHKRLNARIPRKPAFFAFVASLRKEAIHYDHVIKRSYFINLKKNRRATDIKLNKELKKYLQKLELNEISDIEFLKKMIYIKLRHTY